MLEITTGSGVLHKAIWERWHDDVYGSVDTMCKRYWPEEAKDRYESLRDLQQIPATPFPYATLEQIANNVETRMSPAAHPSQYRSVPHKQHIVDIGIQFRVYACQYQANSGKMIAGDIVGHIMRAFGNHQDDSDGSAPELLALSHGCHINTQYLRDFPRVHDEAIYSWTIEYEFKLDTTVVTYQ